MRIVDQLIMPFLRMPSTGCETTEVTYSTSPMMVMVVGVGDSRETVQEFH